MVKGFELSSTGQQFVQPNRLQLWGTHSLPLPLSLPVLRSLILCFVFEKQLSLGPGESNRIESLTWHIRMSKMSHKNQKCRRGPVEQADGLTDRQTDRETERERDVPGTRDVFEALGPRPRPRPKQLQAALHAAKQSQAKQSELNSKLAIPMRPFILFILIVVVAVRFG